MLIGRHIKQLRKSKKMTLVELSSNSGVQVATLSRIENEKMVGTLESHMSIAKALGIDVTALYKKTTQAPETIDVETPGSLTDQFKHSDKAGYEILTKNVLNKKMMPVLIRLDPGGETPVEQGVAGSEKFVFVLEGKIEVKLDDQTYILEKAHTLYFNASLPHRMRNTGEKTARVLCVGTPVTL